MTTTTSTSFDHSTVPKPKSVTLLPQGFESRYIKLGRANVDWHQTVTKDLCRDFVFDCPEVGTKVDSTVGDESKTENQWELLNRVNDEPSVTVLPFVIDKHKRLYLLTQKGYCITAPRVLSELQAAQKEKQASQAHGLSQDEVNSHLAKMEEHISNACRHGDTLGTPAGMVDHIDKERPELGYESYGQCALRETNEEWGTLPDSTTKVLHWGTKGGKDCGHTGTRGVTVTTLTVYHGDEELTSEFINSLPKPDDKTERCVHELIAFDTDQDIFDATKMLNDWEKGGGSVDGILSNCVESTHRTREMDKRLRRNNKGEIDLDWFNDFSEPEESGPMPIMPSAMSTAISAD